MVRDVCIGSSLVLDLHNVVIRMIELDLALYAMSFFAGLWVGLTIFRHELRKVRKKLERRTVIRLIPRARGMKDA